jgi:hypothetical protein
MSQNPTFGLLSLASVLAHKHANLTVSPRTKCTDCDTHFLLADLVHGRCPECDREITEATARWEARQAEEDKFDERHRRRMERPLAEGELYEPPEVE